MKINKLKKRKAVKGIIFYKYKFLIVRRNDGVWEIPGGKVEESDENDVDALKREVLEEVALDIKVDKFINKWRRNLPEEGINLDGKTYLCKSQSAKVVLSPEHNAYKWISKKEADDPELQDWIRDSLAKIKNENK